MLSVSLSFYFLLALKQFRYNSRTVALFMPFRVVSPPFGHKQIIKKQEKRFSFSFSPACVPNTVAARLFVWKLFSYRNSPCKFDSRFIDKQRVCYEKPHEPEAQFSIHTVENTRKHTHTHLHKFKETMKAMSNKTSWIN